jgi:hypothetical protein
MFKLRLLLSFVGLLSGASVINGAERPRNSDLWQDWARATLLQKMGIGIALVTGDASFLPKQEVKPASSPTSVTGLFSPQAGSRGFGAIMQEIQIMQEIPEIQEVKVAKTEHQTKLQKLTDKYALVGVKILPVIQEDEVIE